MTTPKHEGDRMADTDLVDYTVSSKTEFVVVINGGRVRYMTDKEYAIEQIKQQPFYDRQRG